MRMHVAPKDRRRALKEFTKNEVDPKRARRFLKNVLSGSIDPYVDYKIKKNRFGKLRSISSPFPELKDAQRLILSELYDLGCHSSAHAYIPNHSVVTAANQHLDMTWGIKLDLEDFFHHVTRRHIEKALRRKFGDAKAELYAAICTRVPTQSRNRIPTKYNRRHSFWVAKQWRQWLKGVTSVVFGRGLSAESYESEEDSRTFKLLSRRRRLRRYLPQGSPASGYLANLAFKSLDRKITDYLNEIGFTYTRYSDDILISTQDVPFSRDLAAEIIQKVQTFLTSGGFTLNRAKTRILTPGSRKSYLGLIVSGPMTRLPREVRERLTAELRDIEKFGFEEQSIRFEKGLSRIRRAPGKQTNNESSYWHVLQGIMSWVWIADQKLFVKLDSQYSIQLTTLEYQEHYGDNMDPRLLSDLFINKNNKPATLELPGITIKDIFLDLDDY
jgi:RNA-directed DNA polymerase